MDELLFTPPSVASSPALPVHSAPSGHSPPRRMRVSLPPLALPTTPYASSVSLRRVLRRLRSARMSPCLSPSVSSSSNVISPPVAAVSGTAAVECVVDLGTPPSQSGAEGTYRYGGARWPGVGKGTGCERSLFLARSGAGVGFRLREQQKRVDGWLVFGASLVGSVCACAVVVSAWRRTLPAVLLGVIG